MLRSILAAGMIAIGMGAVAHAENVTLNLGHVTNTNNPYHVGATMFKEAVEARTGGSVDIKIFPSRQLGDDKQLLEGVRLGTIDAALVSSTTFSAYTPVVDALQLPFLVTDYDQWAKVLTSSTADKMLKDLSDIGVKAIGFVEGGQRHFVNKGDPVTTVEGMQGLKVRVVPAPLHLDIWNAIGVNTTPMPYGEIYTSLQTGVLDAVEMNATSIYSENFYEVAKGMTLTGQYFFPAVVVVNPAKFNSLTEAQQNALIQAGQEIIKPQIERAAQMDKEAQQKLKRLGVDIVDFKEQDKLDQRVAEIYEKYEGKDPRVAEFVDSVRAMSEDGAGASKQ